MWPRGHATHTVASPSMPCMTWSHFPLSWGDRCLAGGTESQRETPQEAPGITSAGAMEQSSAGH